MTKVSLVPIPVSELKHHIEGAFIYDKDLCKKYHVSPGTFEQCVDHTYTRIKDAWSANLGQAYKVMLEQEGEAPVSIGYTVILRSEPNILYSFGINVLYRTKKVLVAWMEELDKIAGRPYTCVLYKKNKRAVSFLEKNGFEMADNDYDIVVLVKP